MQQLAAEMPQLWHSPCSRPSAYMAQAPELPPSPEASRLGAWDPSGTASGWEAG